MTYSAFCSKIENLKKNLNEYINTEQYKTNNANNIDNMNGQDTYNDNVNPGSIDNKNLSPEKMQNEIFNPEFFFNKVKFFVDTEIQQEQEIREKYGLGDKLAAISALDQKTSNATETILNKKSSKNSKDSNHEKPTVSGRMRRHEIARRVKEAKEQKHKFLAENKDQNSNRVSF